MHAQSADCDKLILMDTFVELLTFLLIAIAVAPLLLLALYVLADRLGFRFADRLLASTVWLLTLQWITGGVVNIVFGLAIVALGVWAVLHAWPAWHGLLACLLVPFGLWRTWRGITVLKASA